MRKDGYVFYIDENNSYCELTYNNLTFTGAATCHPEDEDMKSERTGYFIAEMRANIQKLCWIRDYEILPAWKHYKHFYDCVSHSSKFNKESYEAKCIYKEWKKLDYRLKEVREDIKNERQYLKDYIKAKEEMYQRIRKGKTN